MDSSAPGRLELPSPQRIATAQAGLQPHSQDGTGSDSPIETLYSHPDVKIISFSAAGRGSYQRQGGSSGGAFDEEPGTLSWSSHLERTIAVGPFRIYRAPGSVAFLSCGSALQPILRKSQCWCVDEMGSKFILQIRRPQYWRIELPVSNPEEQGMSQAFREVLEQILQFEKTHCPFQRPFTVSLPEQPDTPVRRKRWTPVPCSPVPSPEKARSSLTKSRSEHSTPGRDRDSHKIDHSMLLELGDSELVSGSHLPLYDDAAHIVSGTEDISAAADLGKRDPLNYDKSEEETTDGSFEPYASFVGRGVLPIGRTAVLRDIFEKLFSLSANGHFHAIRPQVPHEGNASSDRDTEQAPCELACGSSVTGLPAPSLSTDGVVATEPKIRVLHDGSGGLSAWMKDRLRRATHSATLPQSTLPTSPRSGASGSRLPLESAVAASPTESQYSYHGTSVWHSPATPLPPSPPMSRPDSPGMRFHSHELSFIQHVAHDGEGSVATVDCEPYSVHAGKLAESAILQDDTETPMALLVRGKREIENRASSPGRVPFTQHVLSSLLSNGVIEPPTTMSEQSQHDLLECEAIGGHPLATIIKMGELLLRLPSYLIRIMLKVAARVVAGNWRDQVFSDEGEQVPIQWHDWDSDSSDLGTNDSYSMDLSAVSSRSQKQDLEVLHESQILDLD